jgi:hypothetical protein
MQVDKSFASRQRGQALAETLVVVAVLVPLSIATAHLGKLHSLRHSNHQAARALVFECTVRPQECVDPAAVAVFADEQRRRAFSRADAPIQTSERLAAPVNAPESEALWVSHTGKPMLASYGDVGVRIDPETFNAMRGVASASALNALGWLDQLAGPAHFGLDLGGGLYVARVQVLAQKSNWFAGLPMQARAAVLTDPWSATSGAGAEPTSVATRVQQGQRLPLSGDVAIDAAYLPVRGFLQLMEWVGLEPAAGQFTYHRIDPTIIPIDRRVQ